MDILKFGWGRIRKVILTSYVLAAGIQNITWTPASLDQVAANCIELILGADDDQDIAAL